MHQESRAASTLSPEMKTIGLIIAAMIAGVICGSILGPRAKELGLIGTTVIGMIKALAGPLILFAILDAFLMSPMSWKQGRRMLAIALFNATIAIAIGLFLANFLRPGEGWKSPEAVAIPKKGNRPRPGRSIRCGTCCISSRRTSFNHSSITRSSPSSFWLW